MEKTKSVSVHPAAPCGDVPSASPLLAAQVSDRSAQPRSPMVVKAAREMARIHAEACNVNKDDLWAIEGQSFIDEAQSVLDACGAPELLQALVRMADEFVKVYPIYYYAEPWAHNLNGTLRHARETIAKALGTGDGLNGSPASQGRGQMTKEMP